MGLRELEPIEQTDQPVGDRGECQGLDRGGTSVPRHVPGDAPKTVGKSRELRTPRSPSAPETVEKNDRRPLAILSPRDRRLEMIGRHRG